MPTKSKSSKNGGGTFGYVEQFNYPLSPCYKNQAKAGWHSGGNGSCSRKPVENLSVDQEMYGGGIFDWIFGKADNKKSTSSTSSKKKKSTSTSSSSSTSGKKKKSSTSTSGKKKKPSKK